MARVKLCIDCGRRPKALPRHRCDTCQLRREPIGVQVEAARRRLAMVPPELRRKRTATIQRLAPGGTAWCAGCQSFRDLEDFRKGATQCRPCQSAAQHGAMVEKIYGLTPEGYDALLRRQGGRCAICGGRPKTKRLAVDHDHQTGAVRGLLCSRCNHELLGSAWDSLAVATALWHYLNTPPASGAWRPLAEQPQLVADASDATRPVEASSADSIPIVKSHGKGAPRGGQAAKTGEPAECVREHYLPNGAVSVPGKRGVWKVWVGEDAEPPF